MGNHSSTGRRPRVLVFNQYYWPGVEATAHLLSDLCAGLAESFDITVVTGMLRNGDQPRRATHRGVEVIRVRSTAFDRTKLLLRALNYLTYLLRSLAVGLSAARPDVVLCMTDPPVIANLALIVARRFKAPLVVVSQDVFPEVAVELKRLENPFVVAVLNALIDYQLRRADRVVAIGETMRQRLVEKGAPRERITVIPNWVDASQITPAPRDNEWAREHGFVDRFVVMHSGNVGYAQNLDALVKAGTFLRDLDDLTIAIIGTGARHSQLVALVERLEADNVHFLPYQRREILSLTLSTADVHVVGLARGLSGYVVPSRLYGILAAGRPVIVAADSDSETAMLVNRVGCGVVLPPDRPDLLAKMIRAAHGREIDLAGMGARAREYAVAAADRSVAIASYGELLTDLTGATA